MAAGRKAPPLTEPVEIELWDLLIENQGKEYCTVGRGERLGVKFTYTIRGAEIFVSTKEKSITRSSVLAAFRKAQELNGVVKGPKELRVFGSSYIYSVFIALGIIRRKNQEKNIEKNNRIFDDTLTSIYNDSSEVPKKLNEERDLMPRPKGSKNKTTVAAVENAEEKIVALEAEMIYNELTHGKFHCLPIGFGNEICDDRRDSKTK